MTDPILLIAKTDRELQLLAIQKLDNIEAKLSETCSQVAINTPRITALEGKVGQDRMAIKWLYMAVLTVILGVVYEALRHVGFPITPPATS